MKLILQTQLKQLLINGSEENAGKDHQPIVKLFAPFGSATWLITEILPENPDNAFGLCDLGAAFPELGYFSLSEILSIKKFGLSIERDIYFEAEFPISVYAKAARTAGHITEDVRALQQASHDA